MKNLILSLVLLTSVSSFAQEQTFSCHSSIGYSCQEDATFPGKFSRNALCFAYGESVVGIDDAEEAKIFSSPEKCESISVTEADCEIVSNQSEKFCAEAAGLFHFAHASCLRCH